jgi:rsbT co-antagonist protein RsbR
MADSSSTLSAELIDAHKDEILAAWVQGLKQSLQTGRARDAEIEDQCRNFLDRLRNGLAGGSDIEASAFQPLRDLLGELSRARAIQGFTPTETAMFVFSLKPPLFGVIGRAYGQDASALSSVIGSASILLDRLALYTMEIFQRSREEVIIRQQREIAELSTPVVKLWDGILALPLIGTLDSERTQVVMENLLQSIVDTGAEIAIIDITGVPTVDTLVAQHLLKTVAAARLMGADCIISGIRPQIAQTMVHLGVELNVVSKASLADALALALQRIGRSVVDVDRPDFSLRA